MAVRSSVEQRGSGQTERGSHGFRADLRCFLQGRDLVLIGVVPAIMSVIFLFPESLKREYAFHYTNPDAVSAFTAHFVHLSPEHLLTNVVAFLVLTLSTYILFALAARRQFFITAFVSILFGFPIVLSLLNLAVPRNAIGFGFSGINAGMLGLLPVALFTFGQHRVSERFSLQTAIVGFLLTLGFIATIVLPLTQTAVVLIGVAISGAVLNVSDPQTSVLEPILDRPGYGDLFVVGGVLWIGFLMLGFGFTATFDGASVNTYVHVLGYALSFMTAVLSNEVWYSGASPISGSICATRIQASG